jgi:DNA-binding protein HU-beta
MAQSAPRSKAHGSLNSHHEAFGRYVGEAASAHQEARSEMLEELTGMIRKHLKKGEQVKIAGLGILRVRNRAARVGRNPATGEVIQIKASKKVAFRASLALKMAI